MLYSIIGMLVIILDQLVKFWVDRNINWTNPTRPLIPGIVSLVRVQNDGAAFSFLSGSGARVWFIILTGVFALLVVIALATHFISGKFGRWCLVLVTAGGLSNMIDRIRYGFVIDMFKIEIFDFAVFNVADIFITVFCIAFILYILFGGEKKREVDEDEFDEIDYEEYDRPRRESLNKASRRRADDYDEERPVKRAPAKKTSTRRTEDDNEDNEFDEEDMPVRRTNKSAAAAANAYRRNSADSDAVPQQKRQRPAALDAPSQIRQRRSVSQDEAEASQVNKTQRLDTSRRSSSDPNIEKMFSSESPAQKQRKPATAAGTPVQRKSSPASAQRRPASQTEEKIPVFDPNNPFAEWEQANARASAKSEFNNYTETETKPSAPAQTPVPQNISKSSLSSDFDLDDILNEFK